MRNHSELDNLQSEWNSKIEPKLTEANQICDAAKEVRDGYYVQI